MLFRHIHSDYTSIHEYIEGTHMKQNYTWGTDIEMLTFAHLVNTSMLVYKLEIVSWATYQPQHVDRSLNVDMTDRSISTLNVHLIVVHAICNNT